MTTDAEAIDIIDKAIAYITEHGFNVRQFGRKGRPCCYFGTLNVVCGRYASDLLSMSQSLSLALSTLDELAEEDTKTFADESKHFIGLRKHSRFLGSIIEAHGFTARSRGVENEVEEALSMLRRAKETLVAKSDDNLVVPADTRELITA